MTVWTTEDFLDAVVTVQQTRLAADGLGHVDLILRRGEVVESGRLTLLTVYKGPPVQSKGRSI